MIFIDANIFMYAGGKASPQLKPCQKFLEHVISASSAKKEKYSTNTEVLQEILHRYLSLEFRDLAFKMVDSILGLGMVVLPVTEQDIRHAKVILSHEASLSVRDAIHAAVMQTNGIQDIATYDRDFDRLPWIHRIEPK